MTKLVVGFLLVGGLVWGQRQSVIGAYGAQSGYGNVVFPGTGTPSPRALAPTGSITNPGFARGLGQNVSGLPYYNRSAYPAAPGRGGTVIVPYAYPVYVGGYDPAYAAPPQGYPMQQAPAVIINQTFPQESYAPPIVREYNPTMTPSQVGPLKRYDIPVTGGAFDPASEPAPADRAASDNATPLYLIAFKDGTVYSALAYWVEGDTLNYVTHKGSINRASLELIDREVSQRLNRERSVDFRVK